MKKIRFAAALALVATAACSQSNDAADVDAVAVAAKQESFAVITAGARIGHLIVDTQGDQITVDYDFKNNGRGPTIAETAMFDESGAPVSWSLSGSTTFGNQFEETYALADGIANWTDAAGSGEASVDEPTLYISQFGSPYSAFIYARALLNDPDRSMPALPAGALRLTEIESLTVQGTDGEASVTTYALTGADLNPDYFILDDDGAFFAYITPRFIAIREGFEAEEERLRNLAADYGARRYEDIQARFAHHYEAPVRIRNVRVFQPQTLNMSEPVSVVVSGERIAAVDPLDVPTDEGEIEIDGAGGSLLPGLYDMHAHLGDNQALLNVLAGVTSVRDMGNEIDVLEPLRDRIENGVIAGPRISMSGFIEGVSKTNSSTGELAATEEDALELVRMFAERGGYHQIKVYSSIKGAWVPAMANLAHELGLRVAGHVPAFSSPVEMIEAGYDELTHINQVMLSWVLPPDADTRTMLRITGIQRFAEIDLESEKAQRTINAMADNDVAHEPTMVIHEYAMLGRNGETNRVVADYIDHMPVGVQRNAKVAMLNIADPEEDARYSDSFDKIIETVSMMRERGIFLVPGTDFGGAFQLHREVELFHKAGFTRAEALRRASYDMAHYLGLSDSRGAIEPGKLADFFLVPGDPTQDLRAIKTVPLVSRGGTFYYPSEIYPEFGIRPFTEVPAVSGE